MFKWNSKSGGPEKKQRDPDTGVDPYAMDDPSGSGAIEELEDLVDTSPAEDNEALHAAQESFRAIESVLQEMDAPVQPHGTSFRMPLQDALMLVPEDYRSATETDAVGTGDISIFVDDFYGQLARGKLSIPLAKFVLDMPPDLVLSEAYQNEDTIISPPLQAVIAAIDPAVLAERTASIPVDAGCADQLPDPFGSAEVSQEPEAETPPSDETFEPETQISEEPLLPNIQEETEESGKVEPGAIPIVVPESAPQEPPTPAPLASDEAPETPAPEQNDEEDVPERFGGLNINTATLEQLLTLPGASSASAQEIIRYRTVNGPFRNVFELRHVPQVGRIRFRKMTGMPYSERHNHRVRKLMKLLGLTIENVHHLPTVARKLTEQPGFAGCIVSDADGLLLAEHGATDCAEAFSAIVPRMHRQMEEVTLEAWPDPVDLLSVCIGEMMFSVVHRGNIYLGAFHSRRKMTKSQLRFVERIAEELAWLLSHRAYVGTSAPWRTEQGESNW